jgi:hypothetical protein
MAIFKHGDGQYVIGSGGLWLPGVYEDERTAKYAFRFPNADLRQLQDRVNAKERDEEKRVITFVMLQELRKQGK